MKFDEICYRISDEVRIKAYKDALSESVKPGMKVFEVGPGAGIFAILALKLGATAATVLNPLDGLLELAKVNDVEGEICILNGQPENLPEDRSFDLVISEPIDGFVRFGQNLHSLFCVRDRFLKDGGRMLPLQDEIWLAPVSCPQHYGQRSLHKAENILGLSLTELSRFRLNAPHRLESAIDTMWEPRKILQRDYLTASELELRHKSRWVAESAGIVHGLLGWFKSQLTENVSLGGTLVAGSSSSLYGNSFFPLSSPQSLKPGDDVGAFVSTNATSEGQAWSWGFGKSKQCSLFRSPQFVRKVSPSGFNEYA